MIDDLTSLGQKWLELSHDRFRLAGLETQQAGISLVKMITAGLIVGILLMISWLALLCIAVLMMQENGLTLYDALLLVVAFNLILVLTLIATIRRNSRHLTYPALLKSLKPETPSANLQKKPL